jgi:DNA replication and repair protein RecF
LKARQPRQVIAAWDGDVVRYGESLSTARSRYVGLLSEHAVAIARNLLGMELSLSYRPGWARDLGLGEALQQSWNHDQESGATQVGPHRAELSIRLDDVSVKDRISRGQQKLLAAALLVAQVRMFPPDSPVRPSLLLDDPAAELDNERLAGLIGEVASQSVQLIVTALHPEFSALGEPGLRYLVTDGAVRPA